jgi:hypothetical protein
MQVDNTEEWPLVVFVECAEIKVTQAWIAGDSIKWAETNRRLVERDISDLSSQGSPPQPMSP